jgi:hypothetical protein
MPGSKPVFFRIFISHLKCLKKRTDFPGEPKIQVHRWLQGKKLDGSCGGLANHFQLVFFIGGRKIHKTKQLKVGTNDCGLFL